MRSPLYSSILSCTPECPTLLNVERRGAARRLHGCSDAAGDREREGFLADLECNLSMGTKRASNSRQAKGFFNRLAGSNPVGDAMISGT